MRNKFSKSFKLGKFSISIFPDEIVFIYVGKVTVHVKSIRRTGFSFSNKYSLLFFSAFFVVGLTSYLLSYNDIDEVNKDDEMKNELLRSSKTDFSNPVKSEELQVVKYRVKKGDTLSKLAKQFGVSIDTICGSNNLRSYDFINTGKLLTIPNKDGLLYKMKKGGQIVSIAKKYKVSLKKILNENNLKNPDFIPVDQVLFIPDAKPQNIIIGFMWPTGSRRITCGYGWRRNPFNRRRREFHQGLDIRARYTSIRASKYGKITYTGWMGGYGKTIIIAHPRGEKTLYAHLSRIWVKRGQYVKQGQSIGRSGNTGRSTGPHLHFEIMKRGRHKNPYYYLRKNR